jgi:APA family basic amino acid/polyamine antiporter
MREAGRLLKVLGAVFGVAAVVGLTIGQGIFRTPGMVAGAMVTPEAIIAMWLVGGAIALISAFAYIELGASMPSAGGPFHYAERAFGPVAGAFTGWTLALGMIVSVANVAYVLGEYAIRVGIWPGTDPAHPTIIATALFFLLNVAGTRTSGSTQIVFSAVKGAVLLGLIAVLFSHSPSSAPTALPAPVMPVESAISLAGFALSLRLIVSTYNGWQDIAVFCEELEDPGRSLPRSMFGGIAAVIVVYVLVNLALLHVLTPAQMAGSDFPGADALAVVLGDRAGQALTLFGMLSIAAVCSLTMMASTRLIFALARGGLLPSVLAQVAPNGTPRQALIAVTLIIFAFVMSGNYDTLSSTSTALYQVTVVVALAAAIALRRREPDLPRPYRMPLYPLTAWLALIVNLALLAAFVYDDVANALLGLAIVSAFTLIWFASARWRTARAT